MDLLDDPDPGSNTPEFTVSEISGTVKKLIEDNLGWVRIRGEVGRVVRARSGHLYFDLKDAHNTLSCMTWKGQIPGLGVTPEEGMEVIAQGRMSAGFQSKYTLNAQHIAIAGAGALMALLEQRKKTLAAEGLFEAARKRPLPYLPDVIGVVTSPQGAVIRDILHRLRDRFARHVLVWPAAVQGAACAGEIARGIAGFNALPAGGDIARPDLIIVARGGGSIEDLWGFNEEIVARAAAASQIPLISAVGHETDTTLIDYVADLRAPTPTAAAEAAVPVRRELIAQINQSAARMMSAASGKLTLRRQRLSDLARALPRAESLLDTPRQRLDRQSERLLAALNQGIAQRKLQLSNQSGSLRAALLTRNIAQERRRLHGLSQRLAPTLARAAQRKREMLSVRLTALRQLRLPAHLADERMRTQQIWTQIERSQTRSYASLHQKIEAMNRLRETLSYRATLARGYAVVRSAGAVITRKHMITAQAGLEIEFSDGKIELTTGPQKTVKSGTKPKKDTPSSQGSLF